MGKSSGLGDKLFVAGYDVSGDIGSLGRIGGGPALLDVTSIEKDAMERIGGIRDGAIDFTSFFNVDAGRAHARFSALPTADVVASYFRGSTLGGAAAGLVAKQANYDGSRGNDGSLTFAVNLQGSGHGLEWGRMLTAAMRTDTGATNGTAVDGGLQGDAVDILTSSIDDPTEIATDGAHGLVTGDSVVIAGHSGSTPDINGEYTVTVTGTDTFTIPVEVSGDGTGGTVTKTSTSHGLSAYLHVFSFTGTSVTVKLQDSADNSSFADITGAAFAAATGITAERIQTGATATIRRYVRAVTTGTFNPATFAVMFARHLTPTL